MSLENTHGNLLNTAVETEATICSLLFVFPQAPSPGAKLNTDK
jgi:hypothetical protein